MEEENNVCHICGLPIELLWPENKKWVHSNFSSQTEPNHTCKPALPQKEIMAVDSCEIKSMIDGETYIHHVVLHKPITGGQAVLLDTQVLMVYGSNGRSDQEEPAWHNFPLRNVVKYTTRRTVEETIQIQVGDNHPAAVR
jgi:hypothetical protein